jgi:trk system potassium uptake protein TrkH
MFDEFRSALHVTAQVGLVLAATMLVPAFVDYYSGQTGTTAFAISAALTGLFWGLVTLATVHPPIRFSRRFGILLVNMMWWLLPLSVVSPLMLGPADLSLIDAMFESVSGFTTTGSTVITDIESLDLGSKLWRSMIQWFGGLGILSIGLLLLPFLKVGGLQLFRLESSDKSDLPLPRFVAFSKSVVIVYVVLTLACFAGYLGTGMDLFDAVNHAMTTLSTGGYSTHDASFGWFPNASTLWVGSIFMAIGGLPFTLWIALAFTRSRPRPDPQIAAFFAVIVITILLVVLLGRRDPGALTARGMAEDTFNVISVITTTGFAAGDYTHWSPLAVPLFFVLTFFGGCSGSTAGGVKIYRFVILVQMVRSALRELVQPNGVFPVRYGGAKVAPAVSNSALVFVIAFAGLLSVFTLILGVQGNDFVTALSGSLTALTNVGPGLGPVIGPAGNFSSLADGSKLALTAAMVIGRLEIMVVLALALPILWRRF